MGVVLPPVFSNRTLDSSFARRRSNMVSAKPAKALVGCGKHFSDAGLIAKVLERVCSEHDIATIVHGGHSANGTLIEDWCRDHSLNVVRYPPNRKKHGRRAEDIRNEFMLHDSKPDMVIAMPGGDSTRRLICLVSFKGVPIVAYDDLLPRRELEKLRIKPWGLLATEAS